ncbi:MAG TPA: radical SAM family heme chaperone HemW [Acidimicrobiia bacterium]|nr:radical SAM family heme chaperone HemW [Acidimicrobiia bacterium]
MGYGVYVHIPFCAHRCDYCDFATWTDRAHLIDDYVDACITDLGRRDAPTATSVFFGGGTPSLIEGDQLARIVAAIDVTSDAEITVECNPDSVDADKLHAYKDAGVNRLSFGVQSFAPHVLRALNRTHDPANVERAIALARAAGFDNVNADIIYGTAGESADDWRRTVDHVIALGVEHVSAYALTVEPPTPLGQRVAAGTAAAPDDDDQADKYVVADEQLIAAGYGWYEISNWARPGRECRHNQLYWEQGDYLAIGCAAHGHTTGRRWWNVRTPERYIERIAANESPEAGHETLAAETRADEAFTLALRTRSGAPVPPGTGAVVADLVAGGLLEPAPDGRVVCTRAGRLVANDLTARILAAAVSTGR